MNLFMTKLELLPADAALASDTDRRGELWYTDTKRWHSLLMTQKVSID
jgi:hypothetical protein